MKIFRKIIVLLLVLITSVSFVGCNEEQTTTTTETSSSSEVILGFESVKELLSIYRLNITKTELNTDTQYITEGNASMKIQYAQMVKSGTYAKDMTVGCTQGTNYFTKTNNSDVKYFSVDVYNPSETEYELLVNVGNAILEKYVLKQGWNKIVTYVERSVLYYVKNETIGFYSLTFRGQLEDDATFYIDNFRYYKAESEEFEKYTFDKTKQVWNTFEKEAEIKTVTKTGVIESNFSTPKFEINRNSKYILTGTGSLKVSFFKKKAGSMDGTAFATVDELLPNFNDYLKNTEDNYYIYFDIFNPYNKTITAKVTLLSTESAGSEKYSVEVKIPANSWSDVNQSRLYLKDIDAKFTGDGISALAILYEFTGITEEGCIYLDSIGLKK